MFITENSSFASTTSNTSYMQWWLSVSLPVRPVIMTKLCKFLGHRQKCVLGKYKIYTHCGISPITILTSLIVGLISGGYIYRYTLPLPPPPSVCPWHLCMISFVKKLNVISALVHSNSTCYTLRCQDDDNTYFLWQ